MLARVRDSASRQLEALLGSRRSAILRTLDRPETSGALAGVMRTTPGAASYHLNTLEEAGLISRRRVGREVIVRRTSRGNALLAIYRGERRPRAAQKPL